MCLSYQPYLPSCIWCAAMPVCPPFCVWSNGKKKKEGREEESGASSKISRNDIRKGIRGGGGRRDGTTTCPTHYAPFISEPTFHLWCSPIYGLCDIVLLVNECWAGDDQCVLVWVVSRWVMVGVATGITGDLSPTGVNKAHAILLVVTASPFAIFSVVFLVDIVGRRTFCPVSSYHY